jgi:hypothetical protein
MKLQNMNKRLSVSHIKTKRWKDNNVMLSTRHWLTLLISIVSLSGCSFFESLGAVTFEGDPRSNREGSYVVLVDAIGPESTHSDKLPAQLIGLPSVVREACVDKRPELFIGPAGLPIAIGAASILMNILVGETKNYANKQADRFVGSFSGAVNVNKFDPSKDTTCVRIRRQMGEDQTPGFDFVAAFVPLSQESGSPVPAFTLRPVHLVVDAPTAWTSAKVAAVDVSVGLSIAAAQEIDSRGQVAPLGTHTFQFHGVKIGIPVKLDRDKPDYDSPLIAIPTPSPTAGTIGVVVKETGSGARQFGKLKSVIETNQAALSQAFAGWVEGRLAPPPQ